jgi:glycosyltransferase involved in cell wall biosynthesis
MTSHVRNSGPDADGAASTPSASERILANFARFEAEVDLAASAYAKGELEMAAFHAATASTIATHTHCGIFSSPRLEAILNAIGRQIAPGDNAAKRSKTGAFRKVLHVGSELSSVGGLTRMISRWIDADSDRTSSVVLTQHRGEVPGHLTDAIQRSGGELYRLNRSIGSRFDWVRTLRRIGSSHDVIILHIHCEDVIPVLAFADESGLPPILFLNHADHLFWLGTSVADLVLNLRDAATDISISRRGVEVDRNFLLPTIVAPTTRLQSRADAKSSLGLRQDSVLLLSVARRPKYRSIDGMSFADRHIQLLEKYPQAELVVVGSGEPDDWQAAKARVGGRITGLSEVPDPKRYFEAADIYVDSYPFVSSTSMMEAAGYGLPAVTIFALPDAARIFGINHVGLVGTCLVARTADEYETMLERLVVDEAFRNEMGEAAREAIERLHVPPGWRSSLEAALERVRSLPARASSAVATNGIVERPYLGSPDDIHQDIVGAEPNLSEIKMIYMGALPLRQRIALWSRMRRQREISGPAAMLRLLLPEWLKRTIKP